MDEKDFSNSIVYLLKTLENARTTPNFTINVKMLQTHQFFSLQLS